MQGTMTDKQIINDQKNTIHRLQQECTEKTNTIIALGEQLKRIEQELKVEKQDKKYIKECCIRAGKELSNHSFEWDGKEKNLVVQAMQLNEDYERKEQENKKLKEENHYLNRRVEGEILLGNCYKKDFAEEATRAETYKQALEEIREYINSQGIDNKWNMRIQRFRMGILNKINEVLK